MRSKHLKFHITAIAAITVLITFLYVLFGPSPHAATEEAVGDFYIRMDNATWGKNCDPYIPEAQRNWRAPADGTTGPARPAPASYNNALSAMKQLCEGKSSCRLRADSTALGIDPLSSCYKRLVIGYRCSSFDRLWTQDLGQGDVLTITCKEGTVQPTGAAK